VTFEVILLALASTIRPTSLAAVYTLLSSRAPRRLMIAYVIAGLIFTIAVGVLVVWAFHGIAVSSGTDRAKGIADIVGSGIVLGFAVLVLTGRVTGPHAADAPRAPGRWEQLLDRHRTVRAAALAGPATHIPGIFYLVALNLIVAHHTSVAAGVIEILLYNVIWFALPITALTICIIQPDAARTVVGEVAGWTRDRTRTILVVASLGIGIVLLVHGLITV
jgi:Sap, sulfolipid-1-addressing protein